MGVFQLTDVVTTNPLVGGLRDFGSVISPLDTGFALNDNSSPNAGPVLNEVTYQRPQLGRSGGRA